MGQDAESRGRPHAHTHTHRNGKCDNGGFRVLWESDGVSMLSSLHLWIRNKLVGPSIRLFTHISTGWEKRGGIAEEAQEVWRPPTLKDRKLRSYKGKKNRDI